MTKSEQTVSVLKAKRRIGAQLIKCHFCDKPILDEKCIRKRTTVRRTLNVHMNSALCRYYHAECWRKILR